MLAARCSALPAGTWAPSLLGELAEARGSHTGRVCSHTSVCPEPHAATPPWNGYRGLDAPAWPQCSRTWLQWKAMTDSPKACSPETHPPGRCGTSCR